MEYVAGVLIAITVIALTALLFGGWVIVSILRGAGRAFGWLLGIGWGQSAPAASSPHHVRCPRSRCHAENPQRARFCRRCGKPFAWANKSIDHLNEAAAAW